MFIFNRKPKAAKTEEGEEEEEIWTRVDRSDKNLVKKHLKFDEFHDSRVIESHPSGRNFANHEFHIYTEDPYSEDNGDDKGKKLFRFIFWIKSHIQFISTAWLNSYLWNSKLSSAK